jgi:sugar phosphate isomerase/epimerase
MLTRRLILGGMAGSVWGASPAALRLGFSLYGMKGYPLGEAIETLREIGYEGIEVCLLDGWKVDQTELLDALKRTRMQVASFMEKLDCTANRTVQDRQLARLRAAADLSLTVGGRSPAVIETVLGGRPADWEPKKEYMADRVREWAGAMERRKVVLCVKAHVGAAVDTPEKLLWLHKKVANPFLKLTYDYSHFQLMGLDPAVTMKQVVPHARFLHVKEAGGTAEEPRFLIPGDGMLDFKEHFRQLKKFGYRGWAVVEVSSQIHMKGDYNALKTARQCFERLRTALD